VRTWGRESWTALGDRFRVKVKQGHNTSLLIFLTRLIDDGAVLQTPEIEHSHTSICATTHEDINTLCAKPDIENFLIMSNELCFSRQGRYIPDGARGIDR